MKKIICAIFVFVFGLTNAQEQTKKGKFIIEANAGSLATGNTSLYFSKVDFITQLNIGLDGGYFLIDNLAIKAGVGYGLTDLKSNSNDDMSNIVYKIGAQYYIINKIPVGIDFTGRHSLNTASSTSSNWIGVEAGYAIFLGPNVAITPKLRNNFTLDESKSYSSFQGLVGFVLFF
ncbi:MAG: hypothetical protein KBC56_09965 [Flavobacterium sp.]|nr:hypothetical protein [Flavobacterium sp.]